MKRLSLSLIAVLLLTLGLPSCSAKKVVKASYPEYTSQGNNGPRTVSKVKDEIDECQQASMNAPANEFRAYGSAIDEDRDFALHQAILFAKADLVDRLESLVINVEKGYREKLQAGGKTSNEGHIRQDVGTMAEGVVKNCRIVCSNRYRLSDGTYECSVCISIPATDAEKVAGAATINEDERLGVEFHEQQFRNSYREELERFRQQSKENH